MIDTKRDLWEEAAGAEPNRAVHPFAGGVGGLSDVRAVVVLKELENKVICSGCSTVYRGPDTTQENEAFRHSIRPTRYGSVEDDQLSVDLSCQKCGNRGAYLFAGNPLRDAPPLDDVMF
jgi:hypothetical protein